VEDAFPGGREVIRESFRDRLVPSAAIPALPAPLSPHYSLACLRPLTFLLWFSDW